MDGVRHDCGGRRNTMERIPLADYEPQAPYAIRQFEIDVLIPIEIFGHDLSFTTSAQAMVTTTVLVSAYLLYGLRSPSMIPGRIQASIEAIYLFVAGTVIKLAGREAERAVPFIFTLFVFILFGSLFGITPLKFTFTSHLIVTFALSLMVFAYVNYLAFETQGLGFFKSFMPKGTPLYMAPLIIMIELISYVFRPVTLGVRIFANILAGHIMIKLFGDFAYMLTDALGATGAMLSVFPLLIMAGLYGVEIMVVIVQSYIFIMITSLYIRDALHPH